MGKTTSLKVTFVTVVVTVKRLAWVKQLQNICNGDTEALDALDKVLQRKRGGTSEKRFIW